MPWRKRLPVFLAPGSRIPDHACGNMPQQPAQRKPTASSLHDSLDRFLSWLGTYALPVAIGVMSLVALTGWQSYFQVGDAQQLRFQFLEEAGSPLSAEQASAALLARPGVERFDSGRSEAPFWFRFAFSDMPAEQGVTAEFPSRHMTEITCWEEDAYTLVGAATRARATGNISMVKAGFALGPYAPTKASFVCRARFVGPASLTLMQWRAEDLAASAQKFHRESGLLDGGLIVLALFMLITALIIRQTIYVLFSAWLIANLRLAALSAGWDVQWLGQAVPHHLVFEMRLVTTAVYYVLTVTMFRTLFRDDLMRLGSPVPMRVVQWMCVALLLLSVTLSYQAFLPVLWAASVITVLVVGFLLVRILLARRSPVAVWYAASFAITMVAGLSEVVSAALGFRGTIGTVNSVTAALSSSLLAALAVAEHIRMEHRERIDAQEELEHTYEAMPIGLFTLDLEGRFKSANPALSNMLGDDVMKGGGAEWERYFKAGSWSELLTMVHMQPDGELEIDDAGQSGAEARKRFLVKATLARGKIEGSLQDVTEKAAAIQELMYLAENDPLTKVFNRRGIESTLDRAMQQLAEGKPLALAYLDINRFKLINSLYGHAVGDAILRMVCDRVKGMLATGQHMGRVGGDEFVIVMPDTSIQLAAWSCRGIIAAVGDQTYGIADKALQVHCSIGLIEISEPTHIKDALALADNACREAKRGAQLVVYEKDANVFRQREAEFSLAEHLSGQLATTGLYLDMQPIMSLKDPHASLNFEVLVRMRGRDGVVVSADRLIPAAEGYGRTGVIDRWVMGTTLEWINAHLPRLSNTQFVCMNLNGASLNDERFVRDAFDMLERMPRAACRLCIEITESVALQDLGNTRHFIDRVRGCGAKVALDDFGAGYTSFSYLRDLPADVLKIDGSFIVNMVAHPANVAIVEAIVSLALSLGMKTIAEWAEDNVTVQTLSDIGVDYVQGYAIARPQRPENILMAASAAAFIQNAELAYSMRRVSA